MKLYLIIEDSGLPLRMTITRIDPHLLSLNNLSTAEEKMRRNCLTIIRTKEIYESYNEDISS